MEFIRTLSCSFILIPAQSRYPIIYKNKKFELSSVGHITFILMLAGRVNMDINYLENVCPVIEELPIEQQLEILGIDKKVVSKNGRYFSDLLETIEKGNLIVEANEDLYARYMSFIK